MSNDYRCVTEQEREQYNKVIAKEQTCVSEDDLRDLVENKSKIKMTERLYPNTVVFKGTDGNDITYINERVIDEIRTEIEQTEIKGHIRDAECFRVGLNVALNIIDKYMK